MSNTVARSVIESRLLAGIKEAILFEGADEIFEDEANKILAKHDSADQAAPIKGQLKQAETERDNLVKALKAGIITVTTKNELETAERKIEQLGADLARLSQIQPETMLPMAKDLFRTAVNGLEHVISDRVGRVAGI